MSKIDEKNTEINNLKQKNGDLELQINKIKFSLDETKKNYDTLLINSKSAEKINYYMNKVSQLNEEKGVILSTNSEAIRDLSNQITQLNIQLNEYKKKELNENKNISVFEKEKDINNTDTKKGNNVFNSDTKNESPAKINKEVSKLSKDNKNLNEKTETEKVIKREEGFLTRFLAPIFLTENERSSLSNK